MQKSVVPPQTNPVHHEDGEDAGSVTSDERVQSNPDSDQDTEQLKASPSTPSLQSYNHEASGSQHPFGLLLKEHSQQKTAEGVSFPTMMDFKHFIDRMKSSFLRPGSDLNRHFQTARDVIKSKIASDAHNTDGESHTGVTPDPEKEDKEQDEAGENEVWSESVNTEFEEGDPNYQTPSDPVDQAANLITDGVHHNQGLDMDSAVQHHHLLADHAANNNEWSDSDRDTSINAPQSPNYDAWSINSEFSVKSPSHSFYGEDLSFNHPPDFSSHSSKIINIQSPTAEENIQPHEDNEVWHHKASAGGGFREDLQKDEAGRRTHSNDLSAPEPTPLNSYGNSMYVNAPRGLMPFPEHLPKQGLSSSSENPSPKSINGQMGAQASSPQRITVESSSLNLEGYPREQRVHISINPAPEQTSLPTTQEPKQVTDSFLFPRSDGSGSSQTDISSQVGLSDASFNSIINLAPESETAFSSPASNEIMSRNTGIKNVVSDRKFRLLNGDTFSAKRHPGPFPIPQKQSSPLNGGLRSAARAGHRQTFTQPNKVWKHPSFTNKAHVAFQHLEPLSASRVDTKGHPPQTGLMIPPPLHSYTVKTENGFLRGEVFQSKSHYDPHQQSEGRYSHRGNPWRFNYKKTAGIHG
ncbi:uncharacterized protein LOC117814453 [Xyrichtys novacula]|nr:uncharacterized protein LOC117814453 [Xyrichtys novacula]